MKSTNIPDQPAASSEAAGGRFTTRGDFDLIERIRSAQIQDRPGRPPPGLPVSWRDLRRRPHLRQHRRLVRGDPGGHPAAQDQPFYHLLAENEESEYIAYVSEQNLVSDDTGEPVRHPQVDELFDVMEDGSYHARGVEIH